MATPDNVKMGVCTVEFNAVDLGYTSGGCKYTYSAETVEKIVDQEDAPLDEIITKQTFEVTVPLAEQNLTILADLLPGATLTTGASKSKLVLSGAAGTSLLSMAQELILKPVGGNANDWVTLHHAIPKPNIEVTYDKEKVRVYEVTFKAMKGLDGFVTFGDVTATGV